MAQQQQQGFLVDNLVSPLTQFLKQSQRLLIHCNKPDRKEFQKVAMVTGVGFLVMGFIGFFVRLVHIPINNILMR